jgi:hypothetical protein
MSSKSKRSATSAKSVRRVASKAAKTAVKKAAKKTGVALAVVAKRRFVLAKLKQLV